MALCRVYLLTYRRNNLLPRALQSLIDQTFTDWICELHNDDPNDQFPSKLVEGLSDDRVTVVNHSENLGPTQSFNLVFKKISEPFICLLEDDNWWESSFLATMLDVMNCFPHIHLAWSNMRYWRELPDGTWEDTGDDIWDCSDNDSMKSFNWGQQKQVMGALHSNGSSIVRSQYSDKYLVPAETDFASIELVRERSFIHPILFVPKVCANFAITQQTARSRNRIAWSQVQILLIASFFKHMSHSEEIARNAWIEARMKPAKSTSSLFFASLVCSECRWLLKYATLKDLIFVISYTIRRPILAFFNIFSIRYYPYLWAFLDKQTSLRLREIGQDDSEKY